MRRITPLILSTATAIAVAPLSLPAPAHAAPSEDFSILSSAGLTGVLIRVGVSYARVVSDVRYGSLQVDDQRGTLTLRDLTITGLDEFSECRIGIGTLELSGISLWSVEEPEGQMNLRDVTVANNCFGANAATIGVVTGGPQIVLSDLSVSMRQGFGSGKAVISLTASSPGLARLSAAGDFDYFALSSGSLLTELLRDDSQDFDPNTWEDPTNPETMPEPADPPLPRGTLRSAHVSLTDLGGLERLKPMLPPQLTDPAAIDGMVTAPAGTPLGNFQAELAQALKTFMDQSGTVTVQVRPEAPIDFDFATLQSADAVVAHFAPQVTNALPTPPVPLIADLSDESDPRALGLALASGQGAPRDPARALDLLQPLAGDPAADPQVELTVAELMSATDPVQAYGHAVGAAAARAPGGLVMLDRIEADLPTADILRGQEGADTAVADEVFVSPDLLRDEALRRERGEGVARSYALAYRLALLAGAAGDLSAQSLITRLDQRFGNDEEWTTRRDAAIQQANTDWTDRDLGQSPD